jgi:hypothetical protein
MEECIICFEENDFVTFPCNHKVCVLCYPKLKRCPLCNIPINETSNAIIIEVRPFTQATQSNPVSREPFYFDTRVRIFFYLIILAIFILSMSKFD